MPNLGLCKACKGKVSSEATVCPHCGQPNPYEDQLGQVRALAAGGKKIDAIEGVPRTDRLRPCRGKNFCGFAGKEPLLKRKPCNL